MDDLPSISALRDEESPPPPEPEPSSSAKFRIKLPRRPHTDLPFSGPDNPHGQTALEEDELEEDQLIDDDELAPDVPSVSHTPAPTSSPKKPAVAKKPRVSKKANKHNPDPVFMVSTFEVGPSQSAQILQTTEDSWIPVQPFATPSSNTQGKQRRKPAAKKEKPPLKAKKAGGTKGSERPAMNEAAPSEVAFGSTNPPSPMAMDIETHEFDRGSSTAPHLTGAQAATEGHAEPEQEPVPVWPLPARTFAVQPPPKLTSSSVPSQPLDKTLEKVRKWRTVQREIRGIAGGRWFVRSWVGDRDSPYAVASAVKSNAAAPAAVPKQKKFKFIKPELPPASALGSEASTPAPAPAVSEMFVIQQEG